jgi:hypothetical protein
VEYFPVGDDGRKQLPGFISNIDLVDGLPFVGENPVERNGCYDGLVASILASFLKHARLSAGGDAKP